MPTNDNLMKTGCAMASICNLCYASWEDANHRFLRYLQLVPLWHWIRSTFLININSSSIPHLLLSCSSNRNSQVKVAMSACVIHTLNTIWFCRNQARFEGVKVPISTTIAKITRETTLSGNSSSASATPSLNDLIILKRFSMNINLSKAPRITDVIWNSPPLGWIKVNTDGAAHGSPSHSGGGGSFRDKNGLFFVVLPIT
ncbi:PREDICTED: uncharacterized protein LOC109342404 [Lupinus angustifolius]|uniref:uncharacterized protein LOC109342404 n=1 Tax=Lupinus angustifolius TaxID=3871 RepID=UPI00092FA9EE|nr:PREDICTED: uncharacterized protein LOC109342404 [Lupinus angustifolius]